jgi:hypothetical protein
MFLALLSFQGCVLAGDYKSLSGKFAMGGKTLYDPPKGEPENTHIYFVLTGVAAKDLFKSMDVRAVRDLCIGDGSLTKRLKELQCTRGADGKGHTCWFGVDIKNQRITDGTVC